MAEQYINWADAFANADYIENGDDYPAQWVREATAFRASLGPRAQCDQRYGPHPRQCYDLFLPEATPKGLLIFIHGGYWLACEPADWSHLAAGPLAQGWAVAMPGYTLAPEARIARIAQEVAEAIGAVVARFDAEARFLGPIHLAGHSAGGHLATRMLTTTSPLSPSLRARIGHVTSISGLHDISPLQSNGMNEVLQITPELADSESPALLDPVAGITATAWVGAHERPEFLRQSALLREAWAAKGVPARLIAAPQKHHFDVIEDLCAPESALTRDALGLT